jgi:methionyl-tRNA formyltransferase
LIFDLMSRHKLLNRKSKITNRKSGMNLVFCGTPQFAVPTLAALAAAGHPILFVVSQPDRPSGRGMQVSPTPVKARAAQLGLPVTQPDKIKSNAEFRAQLEALRPDAIVAVAYGRIIPKWMIDLPRHGCINAHASLLPKYRGAAPIQWAIANGEIVTGVTTMRIDEGLDTGDMLLKREIAIAPEDTTITLSPRLAELAAELTVETLRALEHGSVTPQQQDNAAATLAPLLKKEDGLADFTRPAREIHNRLRGFQPWPGVFTRFRGKTLSFWQTKPLESGSLQPGEMRAEADWLAVGCGGGTALAVSELQPEGKKRMSAREFINGYRPKDGERLG